MFGNSPSRYNRVKKNQLGAQLILSVFRQPLHVLGYLGPSSGGTTVCIQQLVLILVRWLSIVHWTTDRPFTLFQKQAAFWSPLPYTFMSKIWCSRENDDEWHYPKRRQTRIRIQGLTTRETDLNLKFRFLYFSSAIISHFFSS